MTFGGWITFLLSTGTFTLIFALCVAKVLRSNKPKMMGKDMFTESFFAPETPQKPRRRAPKKIKRNLNKRR
ncbi:MAG: hypothetical protein IKO42_05655 [Opitutales bacterium]|nr:hypothetical protein [Opitutales bacterium]